MAYYIYPSGTPNHTSQLEARTVGVIVPPYIATGLTIDWKVNGVIVKSGNTTNTADTKINTGQPTDVNFDATDTGVSVEFVIDGLTTSTPVILSNNAPTVSASFTKDAYDRISRGPEIKWQYADADNDPQYLFRVKIGTISGWSDLHDSGYMYGYVGDANKDNVVDTADQTLVTSLLGTSWPSVEYNRAADFNGDGIIDNLDLTIVNNNLGKTYSSVASQTFTYQLPVFLSGQVLFYTVEVSDGAKINPNAPDMPETPRVLVSSTGSETVNSVPEAQDLTIEGLTDGSSVDTKTPVFGWSYVDSDGQPQQAYRIKVAMDANFQYMLWDSGKITNSNNTSKYNFNKTGAALPSHTVLYFSVEVWDTYDVSSPAVGTFKVAGNPKIIVCTVDDKVNPKNLKNQNPNFKWQYKDTDLDPLTAYDIRVANTDLDLGTDSFVGNIWHPGIIHTPESYQSQFDSDGKAFAGCLLPKQLEVNIIYYYQLKVYDLYGESDWYTGFFRLNNPPTVTNMAVLPLVPYNNDDLEAYYQFVDDPGEYESPKTEIKWYMASSPAVEITQLANQKTVPSSFTQPGQTWYFTVRPNDGVDFGALYTSPIVVVSNRPPQAVILGINPSKPRAGQDIMASYILSDPDEDSPTATVEWYKNGESQAELRNSQKVPGGLVKARDVWYFTVLPFDGYEYGQVAVSQEVTIANSIPEILSISVDGMIIPDVLANPNPTIAWTYSDFDRDIQKAYRLIVGTQPLRVSKSATLRSSPKLCSSQNQGITAITRSDATILQGNDVFDSGEVQSSDSKFEYLTKDHVPAITFTSLEVERYFRYGLSPDLKTIRLNTGSSMGDVSFVFKGQTTTYQISMAYPQESLKSSYRLLIDGILIDEFRSEGIAGSAFHVFKPARIQNNSRIVISGSSISPGAKAPFYRLTCVPVSKLEIKPFSMALSGYVGQEDGGIKLASLSGTASTSFNYPSGTYDVEFHYITESSGNPTVLLSVATSTILNFTYETGAQERTRIVTGVPISYGDQIKIIGNKNNNASARVSLLIFKPVEKEVYGSQLQEGMTYYSSIKVYDGYEWSDWYSTHFFMNGSAWASRVSNSTGWTIETTMKLIKGT